MFRKRFETEIVPKASVENRTKHNRNLLKFIIQHFSQAAKLANSTVAEKARAIQQAESAKPIDVVEEKKNK